MTDRELDREVAEKVMEPHPDGFLHLRDLIPVGQDSLDKWGDLDEFGRVR